MKGCELRCFSLERLVEFLRWPTANSRIGKAVEVGDARARESHGTLKELSRRTSCVLIVKDVFWTALDYLKRSFVLCYLPFTHNVSCNCPQAPSKPGICTRHRNLYTPFVQSCNHQNNTTSSSPPTRLYPFIPLLTLKFLNTIIHLPRHERQRHNPRNVHLRPKNLHLEAELLAHGFDILQAFLVVGSGATDPDLHFVLVEQRCDFAEGTDDAFEGACDL